MSLIQKLREKYLWVLVVVVILALIGFVLMDGSNSNWSNLFGGGTSSIAQVEGNNIEVEEYLSAYKIAEDNYKSQNPDVPMTEEQTMQLKQDVINELIRNKLFDSEFGKLGITVSDAELKEFTMTNNAVAEIKQIPAFQNAQTGQFDPSQVEAYHKNVKGEDLTKWLEFLESVRKQRRMVKYNALLENSVYAPKFVLDELYQGAQSVASAKAVKVPYESISANGLKVSDDEIKAYMNANKANFMNIEETRDAEFVEFDIFPSASDSSFSISEMNILKDSMSRVENLENFVNNTSIAPYTGKFEDLQNFAPAVAQSEVGVIIGPFINDGKISVAKILEKKTLPDTVKVSSIVIQGQQRKINDDQAKSLADSIVSLINSGSITFDAAVTAFSDDPSKAQNKGDMGEISRKGLKDVKLSSKLFETALGSVNIHKQGAGMYIILKTTEHKSSSIVLKVAQVSRIFKASENTINAINKLANDFVSKATNPTKFDEVCKSLKVTKHVASVSESNESVQGLGVAKSLVKWMFNSSINSVSPLISDVKNKLIVAKLTDISPKGMKSVNAVRKSVEPVLINQKKAESLKGVVGNDLNAFAQKYGTTVLNADTVLFAGSFNPVLGSEPKVIGYLFYKGYKLNTISEPLAGNGGVFVIQKTNEYKTPMASQKPNYEQLRQGYAYQFGRNNFQNVITSLYLKAEVKNTANKVLN